MSRIPVDIETRLIYLTAFLSVGLYQQEDKLYQWKYENLSIKHNQKTKGRHTRQYLKLLRVQMSKFLRLNCTMSRWSADWNWKTL